jgi:predicted dehydrogenase
VTGSRGHVAVTGSTGYRGGGLVRIACDGGERVAEVAPHDVYRSQFEAFAAATAAGGPASASGADGEAALRVADAVERSLTAGGAPVTVAGGAPVTVPLPFYKSCPEGAS